MVVIFYGLRRNVTLKHLSPIILPTCLKTDQSCLELYLKPIRTTLIFLYTFSYYFWCVNFKQFDNSKAFNVKTHIIKIYDTYMWWFKKFHLNIIVFSISISMQEKQSRKKGNEQYKMYNFVIHQKSYMNSYNSIRTRYGTVFVMNLSIQI